MSSSHRCPPHTPITNTFLVLALTCWTSATGLGLDNLSRHYNSTFLPTDVLAMSNKLINQSWSRVRTENPPAETEMSDIPRLMKEVFSLLYPEVLKINETLTKTKHGSYHSNSHAYIQYVSLVNEPFVADMSTRAYDLRILYERVSNSTVDAPIAHGNEIGHKFIGKTNFFPGGAISVRLLSGSVAYSLYQACNSIDWYSDGIKQEGFPHYEFWRSYPPLKSVLISMQPETAPWYCTRSGPGTVFDDHGEGSQHMWTRFSNPIGNITDEILSGSNRVVPMSEEKRLILEQISDHEVGIAPSRMTDMMKEADTQYQRGVEQYDSIPFMILSVAAILSSTVVASVSPGRQWDRIVILIVEAAVVYSFLAITTHCMEVLIRAQAYSLDLTSNVRINFTIPGRPRDIVVAHTNFSYSVVGERKQFPTKLVVTEVVSILSSIIVTGALVMAFWDVKYGKPAMKLPKQPDIESWDLDNTVGLARSVGIDDMEEEKEHPETVFARVYQIIRGSGTRNMA